MFYFVAVLQQGKDVRGTRADSGQTDQPRAQFEDQQQEASQVSSIYPSPRLSPHLSPCRVIFHIIS